MATPSPVPRAGRSGARRAACFLAAACALTAAGARASVGDGRVPLEVLAPPLQQRLKEVMDQAVFRRTVQGLSFRSREALFLYFLDHPDVAAAAARALGVARYRIEARPDGTYWGDDARGAKGVLQVVYADPRKRVVHAQGTYEPKWLPTIYAQIVLVLEFEHRDGEDGRPRVTNDLTGYLRVDNPVVGALARLVMPIVGGAVDRKVARTFSIAGKVSERADEDPAGFLEALRAFPDVDRRHLPALADRLGRPDLAPAEVDGV